MAGANEFQKQMMKEQKEASDALAEVEKLKKKMVDYEDKAKVFVCVCVSLSVCVMSVFVSWCVCVQNVNQDQINIVKEYHKNECFRRHLVKLLYIHLYLARRRH